MLELSARLLMVVGGLGLLVTGIRKKKKFDAGMGISFLGSALFGYMAKSNDVFAWFQMACAIAMLGFAVAKSRA